MNLNKDALRKAQAELAVEREKQKGPLALKNDTAQIAGYLVSLRHKAELTQQSLSQGLGLTRASLANREIGIVEISLKEFVLWCYLCDRQPGEALAELVVLLGLEEPSAHG